jgi:hypothetical protein
MREITHEYATGLHIVAAILAVSILLPFLVRPPKAA